uniref:Uncharacterized protein n=1 Tax=Dictyoglomus turgidum TaxID=513050 RepID=A0A7C3WP82_9BACT
MVRCPYCGKEFPDVPCRSEGLELVVVFCPACKNMSRVGYDFELYELTEEEELAVYGTNSDLEEIIDFLPFN